MISRTLLILLFVASPSFAQAQQSPSREWVVQDVLVPTPSIPGTERGWAGGMALGDHNFDQRCDFMLFGTTLWPTGHSPAYLNTTSLFQAYGQSSPQVFPFDSVTGRFTPISHWREPRTALLAAPSGLRVALHDNSNYQIAIVDWNSKQLLGHVASPPPHPTWGPISKWAGIFWAGDVNQDGFDDLFLEAYAAGNVRVLGMIDGQSMTVPWTYYDPESYSDYYPSLTSELSPPADLNGDGAADFVATYSQYRSVTGGFENVQIAFSGINGQILWEHRLFDAFTVGGNAGGKDVNGDSVADFLWSSVDGIPFSQARDVIQLVDGSNGQAIWSQSWHYLDQLFSPSSFTYLHYDPSFFTAVSGSLTETDLCQVIGVDPIGTGSSIWGVAHLNASDGSLISFQEFPDNMLPWFPEPANTTSAQQFFTLLGDIDRDGFVELFHSATTAEYDNPNILGQPSPGLFYSQKTLFVPDFLPLGGQYDPFVSIPTGANRPCTLLLSTAFDKLGGFMLGEWRTHLAPSPLLQHSLANRPFSITLDGNGEGVFSLNTPPNPSLIGTTIYSRAIVQKAVGSREVWTVSTLGISVIQ